MSLSDPSTEPSVDGPPVRRFVDPAYEPRARSLGELRQQIDQLDERIVALLAERALCVKDATRFKRSSFEVTSPKRQAEVFARVRALAAGHGDATAALPDVVEAAYRVLVAGFIAAEDRYFAESEPIES